MVMPMRPDETEGWSEEELTKIVTRHDDRRRPAEGRLDSEREPRGVGGMSAPEVSGAGVRLAPGAVEADGSGSAEPLPIADREQSPWESSMEAVCECLAWRGVLKNLERRNAEDELGQSLYSDAPVKVTVIAGRAAREF